MFKGSMLDNGHKDQFFFQVIPPDLTAIGWIPGADVQAALIFRGAVVQENTPVVTVTKSIWIDLFPANSVARTQDLQSGFEVVDFSI